jgi:hypothetical protein
MLVVDFIRNEKLKTKEYEDTVRVRRSVWIICCSTMNYLKQVSVSIR